LKTVNDILLLGDSRLYQNCEEVKESDLSMVSSWANDMHEAMEDIRRVYGFGRAIAAPQLGIMKRMVYMNIDKPMIILNPLITNKSTEEIELWDDCMSFPNLLVKVKRHKHIDLVFRDENWKELSISFSDGLSELLQHELDHLDGILCTMRAVDQYSFKWRNNQNIKP